VTDLALRWPIAIDGSTNPRDSDRNDCAGEAAVYQLLASVSRQELALRQLPAFAVAFVVASLFFKFGSFALECLAFLVTWFAIDAGIQLVGGLTAGSDRSAGRGS
jgi:hypothetical protein